MRRFLGSITAFMACSGSRPARVPMTMVNVVAMQRVRAKGAADHGIGIALVDHHRADEREASAHLDAGVGPGHAAALSRAIVRGRVVGQARVVTRIEDLVVGVARQSQAEFLDVAGNVVRAAHQNRACDLVVSHDLHGAQDALFFAFGKHNALQFSRALANTGRMSNPE